MKKKPFWFKRPKNMTENERESLPVGPFFSCERLYSYAEQAAGVAKGKMKAWSEILPVKCVCHRDNDLLGWTDKKGYTWLFGQFKNGAWFKTPFG